MGIKHIKFEEIESTQSWLKENISSYLAEDVLVSTRHQSNGLGRMGNKWSQFGNSIAFSFSLTPSKPVTITPLELGVLIVNFFKQEGLKLSLKWPNDILIKENNIYKKVGGILCHYHDDKKLLVGIGLNLDQDALPVESEFKFDPGALKTSLTEQNDFFHELPNTIYNYILNNRLDIDSIKSSWCESSCHLNKKVKVIDDKNITEGLFVGLGENGEAIISNGSTTSKVISGSLWISG